MIRSTDINKYKIVAGKLPPLPKYSDVRATVPSHKIKRLRPGAAAAGTKPPTKLPPIAATR